MQTITAWKQKISHMFQWKETVEGELLTLSLYGSCMTEAGHICEELSEQVAGMRGSLAARKARAKANPANKWAAELSAMVSPFRLGL